MVPQAVQLFSGSMLENLTLGDPDVPFEAVERAIRVAGAEAMIQTFSNGYDTLIGNGSGGGIQLSSGQRQRSRLPHGLAGRVCSPPVGHPDSSAPAVDGARSRLREFTRQQKAAR